MVSSYAILIAIAFLLGMAGSSFAVGVGFISPWFPKEKQGAAPGVYGLGNAGQSLICVSRPADGARFGWENVFLGVSALLVILAILFVTLVKNAPVTIH